MSLAEARSGARCTLWRHLPAALTLAVLNLAGPLAAQETVVQGRVTEVGSGTPIGGATVSIRNTTLATVTDTGGRFRLAGIPAGPADLLVRMLGYEPSTTALELSPGEVRTIEVRMATAVTVVSPITTTATRDPRVLTSVAAAVTVADTLAIRADRTVGLDEALRMMPGVQARSRYGTDDINIGIRGSAARSRQAVRGVAILLDGIALSESDGAARLDFIDLSTARQVEVVRGPVSALYAGSSNGVVNVISRTGFDSPGATVLAQAGTYGSQKYAGQWGGALRNKMGSAFVAASYTGADNYRDHSDGQITRGTIRADYQLAAHSTLALEATGSTLDTRLPGALTQSEFDANPDSAAPAALTFNFGRADTRYRVGTRLLQGLDASGAVEASAYLYYGGRTLDFPIPGQVVDLNLHRTQIGARLRAARLAGATLDVALGFDYDVVSGTDQRWLNPGGGDHGAQWDDGYLSVPGLGVYVQGEWRASADLALTLGWRYDDVSYDYTSEFPDLIPHQRVEYEQHSPKLTAAWHAASASLLYLSVARGFEVPAIGELWPQSAGRPVNSTLEPKSLWNYEIGAKGALGPRLQYEAAVFYADITGEFVPVTVGGISVPENASASHNFGVELAATWMARPWLDLGATYTYSDFRLEHYSTAVLDSSGNPQTVVYDGNRLPTIPVHRVTADIVTRPERNLTVGLRLDWQTQMYVETGNQDEGVVYVRPAPAAPVIAVPFRAVPARTVAQVNASYRLGRTRLFGSIENLFGLRYTGNVIANASNGAFYEAASGTWLTLGLSISPWPGGS